MADKQQPAGAIDKGLFYLQCDDSELALEISRNDIDNEFTMGSFPHRLLMELAEAPEDFDALQEAYNMMSEARK